MGLCESCGLSPVNTGMTGEQNTFSHLYTTTKLLSNYRILEGATTEVRECFSKTNKDDILVVKIIKRKGLSPEVKDAVEYEISKFNAENNPNFVALYEEEDYYYLVQEYTKGLIFPSASLFKKKNRANFEKQKSKQVVDFVKETYASNMDLQDISTFLKYPSAQAAFNTFMNEEGYKDHFGSEVC